MRTLQKVKEEKFKKKSELLERERNLDTSKISSLQELFWEFHFLRKPTQDGVEPFDPQRMKAHLELSGKRMSRWEYNTLMEMDLIIRSTIIKKRR